MQVKHEQAVKEGTNAQELLKQVKLLEEKKTTVEKNEEAFLKKEKVIFVKVPNQVQDHIE